MPTEQEITAQLTEMLATISTEKFGPYEFDVFVRAAIAAAHVQVAKDCPHLEVKANFSWTSKLLPEKKQKKTDAPTLFS